MKNFITIKVPNDSQDYFINNVGCLRFSTIEGKVSTCIEPIEIGEYLDNRMHKIIGTSILNKEKLVIIEIVC